MLGRPMAVRYDSIRASSWVGRASFQGIRVDVLDACKFLMRARWCNFVLGCLGYGYWSGPMCAARVGTWVNHDAKLLGVFGSVEATLDEQDVRLCEC